MSLFLYLLLIFLWGFSWIAIAYQAGSVALEVSVFYRFLLASCILLIYGKLFNRLQSVNKKDHCYLLLQGLCLFCCNFLCFYQSTTYITSGLTAVVMATAPVFNAIHGKCFYGTPTSHNFWLGVFLGLMGILCLFTGDLLQVNKPVQLITGLLYAFAGTWFFSLGNMLSIRNTANGIHPFTATTYGMLWACFILLFIILYQGLSLNIPLHIPYLLGLGYLALPASVIGFTVYLFLVNKTGANKAAYVFILTPLVALITSCLFEGYQWSLLSVSGVILILVGHLITHVKVPLLVSR